MYYVDTNGIPCNWEFAYYIWSEDIIKHSKNIIDLIEVGDYVNGRKAKHIRDYEDFKRVDFDDDMDDTIYEEQIYSIVTKEQYKSVEYVF